MATAVLRVVTESGQSDGPPVPVVVLPLRRVVGVGGPGPGLEKAEGDALAVVGAPPVERPVLVKAAPVPTRRVGVAPEDVSVVGVVRRRRSVGL